jgi:hypothetical protein
LTPFFPCLHPSFPSHLLHFPSSLLLICCYSSPSRTSSTSPYSSPLKLLFFTPFSHSPIRLPLPHFPNSLPILSHFPLFSPDSLPNPSSFHDPG